MAAVRNLAQERGRELVLLEPIAPAVRDRMRARLVALANAVSSRHADAARHTAAIGDMLGCWPSLAKADSMRLSAKFVKEVADLPSWAVERACMAIRRGDAPDVSLDFPPSTIRLRVEVQRHTAAVVQEAMDLQRLLEARVEYQPTAEERERVSFGFQQLVQTMRGRVELEAAEPRQQAPTDDELLARYGRRPAAE